MKTETKTNFIKINKTNLEIACKIQNTIFPEEDARQNFIEQINQDPYRKEMDYYIVYIENIPIGITGIYSYNEYPDDAWLGEYIKEMNYINIVVDRIDYKNIDTKQKMELIREHALEYIDRKMF